MIELVTRAGGLEDVDAPLRAVGAFAPAGEADGDAPRRPVPTASAAAALAPLGDPVDELVALGFDGAAGSTVRVRVPGDGGPRTVLVVGLGPAERCTRDVLRRAAGVAVRAAADVEVLATDLAAVAAVADVTGPGSATPAAVLRAVAEGALLGAYRFDAYRSRPRPMRLGRVVLAGVAPDGADDALARARAGAAAATWVRDLVNTPPAEKRPVALADRVAAAFDGTDVAVRVLDEAALAEGGYGGILGVGRGSSVPPRLVELRWDPAGATRHVALVGKGITFDTGGYSLKPTAGMETMKMDMAGAATVAAVVRAAAALRLPVAVTAVLALAENLVSGDAQRVSDVLRLRGGTTVEVMNTDAEGRLVLGDGIAHAAELEPDVIVDVATLTGAIIVSLGDLIGGLFANDDELAARLAEAGTAAGEPLWRLPLGVDEYGSRLEGAVADLRNVTTAKDPGSIVAALFLHRTVPAGTPWAHLDIAGTAWRSEPGPYHAKGGTGTPVRTLLHWLEGLAA
ncbi:MAG: leucyl aminopeptidase [Nitriliruptoraceae bacterium]